jgi:hypothetical protein
MRIGDPRSSDPPQATPRIGPESGPLKCTVTTDFRELLRRAPPESPGCLFEGHRPEIGGPVGSVAGPQRHPATLEFCPERETRTGSTRCDEPVPPDGDGQSSERPVLILDPVELALGQPFAPAMQIPAPANPSASLTLACAPREWVKRCLVNADGRSGRVRLELSPDGSQDSVVELAYDGDRGELLVEVEVDQAADDATLRRWRALGKRLLDRGLPLTAFEIR